MASDQPPEPPIPALISPAPQLRNPAQNPANAPSFAYWTLLNPFSARHSSSFAFGILDNRPVSENTRKLGYSFAIGEGVTTISGLLTTGAIEEHELRFVPSDALSLGLWRYQWEAGPRLGPFEPRARVGVTFVHLDIGHRFSFGMVSPRVGLGLWLKLAHTRIGLSAYSEYSWRWFGSDSTFVHGLTFEIQPDAAPLIKHTTSSPSAPDQQLAH